METEARVIEIVARVLDRKTAGITRESRFVEDLEADSLDQLELVMDLEETFRLSLDPQQASAIKTVGQAIDAITALLPSA